jgi:RHS repeat-associated protein
VSSATTAPSQTWLYDRAPLGTHLFSTTVTDPNSNQTVINFAEDTATYSFYETQRKVNQLINGTQTLLAMSTRCYNAVYANCSTATVSSPITQTDVYSMTEPNGVSRLSEITYNTFGLVTDDKEYDYGVTTGAAPGTTKLVRETVISYASLGNGIVDKPSSVTVYDWTSGTAKTISSTTYAYDGTTPTATIGTPQHVSITGSRGNVTTLTMSASSSSTTSISKTFTYYDTGTPNVVTDVNGAQTTFVYGSGSCGNSFATTIKEPLNLTRSITWNCVGGVTTKVTDENSNNITSNYTDPDFWRPANVYDQANNETTISYIGQTAVEAALVNFNGGKSVSDSRSTVDGFGRPILNQRLQGPSATHYDTAETDYNNLGQPSRTTMPFSTTAGGTSSTAPGATTTYDALGRVLTVADTNGGTASYTYTNNDVLQQVSGTQTFQKQVEYDGLGRLTSVCEISSTLTGVGACGQNVPQTGYLTRYTYDALAHLLTVTQNAQDATTTKHQTRSFTYDWLGRMTSETNPETGNGASGTVTYSYDPYSFCWYAGADGELHTRTDSAGNVTCYLHDALHRLTDAAGWANNTWRGPCHRYRYDASTNGVVSPGTGWNLRNLAGHPVEAVTDTCASAPITDEWFSYSPRGELTDLYESTPHSGGYYHTQASYWPTGTINSLSALTSNSTPLFPTVYYGASDGSGLDSEGRVTKVTAASGTNPVTGVTYDTSGTTEPLGVPTQVTFGSADNDSFTYDPNTGRMKTYTFSVNSQTDKGTLTWNTNGTLQKLVIADQITGTSDSQTCNYLYDDLQRLSSANCGALWTQNFTYDAFGNIQKNVPSGSGGLTFLPTYGTTNPNNQFTSLPGITPKYDGNGNLLTDNLNTYTWEPNWGTMTTVSTGSTTVTSTYDALGRMVENNAGGSYSEFIYGPTGAKLAKANGQTLVKAFIALPGGAKAIYNSSGLAYYRHSDWLGTSRLASSASRTLYSSSAYAPFGEQYKTSGTADASFTGQNSDTVSSLYDFQFRESSPSQGRWISPDPAGILAVDPTNPQSWNRYTYVNNNPLALVDPLGLCDETDDSDCGGGGGNDGCTWDSTTNTLNCDPGGGSGGGGGSAGGCPVDPATGTPNCPSGGGGGGVGGQNPANSDINKTWTKTFSCDKSATQVMSAVQKDMGQFADNRGSFFAANFPDQPLTMGGQYSIKPAVMTYTANMYSPTATSGMLPVGNLAVTVTSQSATGWTFTTDPSRHYFDGTVSFSSTDAGNGNVTFSITANANWVSPFTHYTIGPIILAGENSTWNNMLNNVQGYCTSPIGH